MHLFAIEHEAGDSGEVEKGAIRVGQADAGVVHKGEHEDPFGLTGVRAVSLTVAAIALGQTQFQPVGGPIDAAMKAAWVDKGFDKKQRMPESCLPIPADAPGNQPEHTGSQVRQTTLGQNQEPAVVGDQAQAVVLGAKVPADPAITRPAFEGRRREADLRQPLILPGRDIPDRLADFRECAKLVVPRHPRLQAILTRWAG